MTTGYIDDIVSSLRNHNLTHQCQQRGRHHLRDLVRVVRGVRMRRQQPAPVSLERHLTAATLAYAAHRRRRSSAELGHCGTRASCLHSFQNEPSAMRVRKFFAPYFMESKKLYEVFLFLYL